jgi:hypothetical protein
MIYRKLNGRVSVRDRKAIAAVEYALEHNTVCSFREYVHWTEYMLRHSVYPMPRYPRYYFENLDGPKPML